MKPIAVLLLFGTTYLTAQVTPLTGNPSEDNPNNRLAKVEGKMVNSVSGRSVAKVTLTLRSYESPQPSRYVGTSDQDGSFVIDHLEPGRYTLFAEKPGFLRQYYGAIRTLGSGTPLMLSEGQHMKELLFKLTPQSVISGMVTDGTGEPMDKVSVAVMQWGYWRGRRLLRPVGGALTNDLGEYRIANLSPGSYYLVAHRGDVVAGSRRVTRADAPSAVSPETPEEGYGTTYYPGSLDPSGAAALQVAPGSELNGVAIQVRKARVFRVRGQVVDGKTGQLVTEARVALTPSTTDSLLSLPGLGGTPVPGGKFEVTGVLPGSYHLMAQVTQNGQTLYARQPLSVGNRNVTDIVITIPPAVDVAGRVRVSGQDLPSRPPQQPEQPQQQSPPQEAFRLESVRIVLGPAEGFGVGPLPQTTAQADGSFVLRSVVPDKFRVIVMGTPPAWYPKSILLGGRESPDGIADLTGGGTIEILLAMGTAEVSGFVVDGDDKPASGAEVTLVPEDAIKQGRADLYRIATSDQNGQFQIGGVVPGSYKIFAWQEVESDAAQDPEFRRPFESKAKFLALSEKGRETVRLKAISVEDVARALGNRPSI